MTLPTALWCRARAVVFADAAASMLKGFEDDAKYAAALRIATRVLDEKTEDWLQDIVLLAMNGDIDQYEAVADILAYLKGGGRHDLVQRSDVVRV